MTGINYDESLFSADKREALYAYKGKYYSLENPAYKPNGNSFNGGSRANSSKRFITFGGMTKKDFLSSIPMFSDFSNEQLSILVDGAIEKVYKKGVRKV